MAPRLPSSALQILSLTPPTPSSRQIQTTLLPASPATLNPSTSLSFEFKNGTHEVFIPRLTYRDLLIQNNGTVVATVDQIPRFSEEVQGETDVRLHVWKGEKLLGSWDIGRF